MANDITMQQKIKVINKLVDAGCDTEKKLAKQVILEEDKWQIKTPLFK